MHTIEELKKLKKQWYEDAVKNGDTAKLRNIGRYLGEKLNHNYGPKYRFKDDRYDLYIDDYGNYLTLHMDGKLVVSTHNERLFVKSIAEPFINQYYSSASFLIEEENNKKQHTELDKLKEELMLK